MPITNDEQNVIRRAPDDVKPIVEAIFLSNNTDLFARPDKLIDDAVKRNARVFDLSQIDLSVDRSTNPEVMDGGGLAFIAFDATDGNAEIEVSFERPESVKSKRFRLTRGKRIFIPYSKVYIYHSAQAGKTMTVMRAIQIPNVKIGVEDDSGESANAEMNQALGVSATYTTGQVSIGTSATQIKGTNSSRRRITVKNPEGGADVFIGKSGVSTSGGYVLNGGDAIVMHTEEEIYGIVGSGTQTVHFIEE